MAKSPLRVERSGASRPIMEPSGPVGSDEYRDIGPDAAVMQGRLLFRLLLWGVRSSGWIDEHTVISARLIPS